MAHSPFTLQLLFWMLGSTFSASVWPRECICVARYGNSFAGATTLSPYFHNCHASWLHFPCRTISPHLITRLHAQISAFKFACCADVFAGRDPDINTSRNNVTAQPATLRLFTNWETPSANKIRSGLCSGSSLGCLCSSITWTISKQLWACFLDAASGNNVAGFTGVLSQWRCWVTPEWLSIMSKCLSCSSSLGYSIHGDHHVYSMWAFHCELLIHFDQSWFHSQTWSTPRHSSNPCGTPYSFAEQYETVHFYML